MDKRLRTAGLTVIAAAAAGAIAALIVRGEPPKGTLWKLVIDKDGAKVLPADDLKGASNYKAVEKLIKNAFAVEF